MTEYEDKARAALDWALKHIAFRHEKRVVADVALAMEELVAAEREACAKLVEDKHNATLAVCGGESGSITQATLVSMFADFCELQGAAIRARKP